MKGTMKVAVMNGIGKMGYTTRPIPTPKEDEVLVKLEYVGICGSDMHYYETGAIGNYVVKPPFVLGHEPGGTVVEVGSAVKHLKVGDRVALEPGKTCGHCKFCREGKYNLCPDVVFFATPPVDGVFQEYVAHEANLCFKLPDNVSTMEGALIEPLAVGFHAANQGGAHAGQTAVVMGAGCIGLVSIRLQKTPPHPIRTRPPRPVRRERQAHRCGGAGRRGCTGGACRLVCPVQQGGKQPQPACTAL